ncbi:MAG: YlmH/Sll1252 family protein [Limosilactobacillus sp.]|uniref:YlmH family RNA-binding protein n=1 Tax=Limosilactobacillus sp. TaxID=2773925 RepID=UPI0026FB6C33|nr:YlmH/Sll1252 family protein [Limosilactobacillus sp.]
MEENIKQHFRPDEAAFIDQVRDWISTVIGQYRPVLTFFLNPRQRYIAQTMVNREIDVKVQSNGGWDGAEMQRLLFYPSYYEPTAKDFELEVLEVNYPTKFIELHHRQIMGTLIGEGLERNAFGDILGDEGRWQVVVTSAMAKYLHTNINHIGRAKIKWEPVSDGDVLHPFEDWEEVATTITSLRLDSVVAAGFNYSRNRAKQLVESGNVRLNWEDVTRPDATVVEHDLISVRHAGRIRIDSDNGLTRKNKEKVVLSVVHA